MKILVIGASGVIGTAIVKGIKQDEVIEASFTNNDFPVDIGDTKSLVTLFKKVGNIDAIVCAASRGVIFKSIKNMSIIDYSDSMRLKLYGQINVVLEGMKYLNNNGSITLTSGALNREYCKDGTAAAIANSGIETFVKSSSLEMLRNIRINVISPGLVMGTLKKHNRINSFRGEPVADDKVARVYYKSIYGINTGQIYIAD